MLRNQKQRGALKPAYPGPKKAGIGGLFGISNAIEAYLALLSAGMSVVLGKLAEDVKIG